MKDFFRNNGLLILIAAVLLALVTAVVSALLGGGANPLANLAGIITTPIRSGISAVAGWAEERYNDAFEREQQKEELEELRQRVAELEAKEREYEAAIQENERYRSLLDLRPSERRFDELESAMVTARSTSNWESTLTISKGTDFGVALNDCVVTETGALVGVITQVGANWATVSTVIDTSTEIGGVVARTDSAGVVEGDFDLMGRGRVRLSYLPEATQRIAGDEVLTSGRGGVYPSGLVVGHVEEIHMDESGLTRYAEVAPEADLGHLVQVFVITDFDIVE